jgi:predicted transcriptional regulator
VPGKKQDDSQVLSVRFPHELARRLDRYLDWRRLHQRITLSRNAAMREALSAWLDHQEQLAGFVEPQTQREQFQAVYRSIAKHSEWAAIRHLRHLLPWPRERFDTVLEGLRADHHVELARAEPGEVSDETIQDSYHVHGQLYGRLRWRHCADRPHGQLETPEQIDRHSRLSPTSLQ